MSESIIKLERGDALKQKECAFCNSTQNIKLFGIEAGDKYDGIVLKHFGVCPEHLGKINALLSGEFDIDKIDLERYRKAYVTKGLRLRR